MEIKKNKDIYEKLGIGTDFYPSDITSFKPAGFGTGRTGLKRPDIVEKIKAKPIHKNVTSYPGINGEVFKDR